MSPAKPRRRAIAPEVVLAIVLLGVWVFFSATSPSFRKPQNFLEMTRFFVEPGIVALAMTLIIITGGIDLSVGSIVALCAVCLGIAWQTMGLDLGVACMVAILVGLLAGAVNGCAIVFFRVPPLIVTLATMAIFRGVATGASHGLAVHGFPKSFHALGQGYYSLPFGLKLPFQVVILLVLGAIIHVFLSRTRWGRYLYATGMNESSARYAALPVSGLKLGIYALSGALAGVASIVFVSRVATAKADAGLSMELDVITACVLGGVSIYGGRGSISGTMLGLLIVGSLRRGLDLTRVTSSLQSVYIGAVLILAVFAHQVLVPALQNRAMRRQLLKGEPKS